MRLAQSVLVLTWTLSKLEVHTSRSVLERAVNHGTVSQNHECLSVASSHGVADTLCSVLMFGLATAHHHLIVIFQNITSKMGSGSSKLSAQQVEGVNVVIIGNAVKYM